MDLTENLVQQESKATEELKDRPVKGDLMGKTLDIHVFFLNY